MAAGEEQAVEILATHVAPRERRLESGVLLHRRIGFCAPSALARISRPTAVKRLKPGMKPQRSKPSPVSIMSSARQAARRAWRM